MVQKTGRPRGRPRHFEVDEVLDKAVRVFWAKGYDGATVDDLVEGMGIGRPSLYATFGDKEALFMRCLERYNETVGSRVMRALASNADVRGAIAAFLQHTVENVTADGSPPGCLMGCVAAGVDDPGIRRFVAASIAAGAEHVARRLTEAVAAGELPPDFPVSQRARRVVDLSISLGVRARVGAGRDELLHDAEDGATLVCDFRRT